MEPGIGMGTGTGTGTGTEEFERTPANSNPGVRTRAPRIGQAPPSDGRSTRAPRVERAPRAERPPRPARPERPQRPEKPPKEKPEKKPLFGFGRKASRDAVSVDDIYDEHERKEAAKNAAVKGGAPLRARKEEVERLKPGDSGTFKVAKTLTPSQARARTGRELGTDEMPPEAYRPSGQMSQTAPLPNPAGDYAGAYPASSADGYSAGYAGDYAEQGSLVPPNAERADGGNADGELFPDAEPDRPRGTGVKVDTAPIPVMSVLEEEAASREEAPRAQERSERPGRPVQGRDRGVSTATGTMPEIERQARPDSAGGVEPAVAEGRSAREASAARTGAARPRRSDMGVDNTRTTAGARTPAGTRRPGQVRENRHTGETPMGERTRERREAIRSRSEEREQERNESSRRRMEERERRRSERSDEGAYEPVSVTFFIGLGAMLAVVAVSVVSALKHVEMAELSPMVLCIITLIMLIMGFFLGMIPSFVTLILAAVAMAVGAFTGYFAEVITALVILLGTVLAMKEWHKR